MNSRICYAAYSLVGILIVLTVLLAFPGANRSRAEARAVVSADLGSGTTTVVEGGSSTLSAANLKTWSHVYLWYHPELGYCGAPFKSGEAAEKIAGSITAGYWHRYDSGAMVLGCPDGVDTVNNGTVWFDLSEIISKAPPLHVSVQNAWLHFRQTFVPAEGRARPKPSGECPAELAVATADWLTGYPDDTLVPGDPFATLGSCGPEGCAIDVKTVVNNWLKGEEHGGYANYGFVFKGMAEADRKYEDNQYCVMRYQDFSLTVDYTYDKESPKAPDTYPIICRGTGAFKAIDTVGPGGSKGVGFTFTPGTSKAKDGLAPGQCSWVDRGMRPGEPGRLAQASESAVDWPKELNSSDSYWKFNVYNAGEQLQATSAERVSKPSTDIGKPSPAPDGGTLDTRKNVALALNGASADAQNFTHDGVAGPGLFFEPSFAIDGVLHTTSAGGNYWRDEHGLPSYLEVDFHHLKTIDEIDVITLQVPGYETGADPSESDPKSFSSQGAENFEVKYLVGTEWKTVPNGLIVGNNRAFVKITFLPIAKAIKTSKIRVYVTKSGGPGGGDGIARIVELQAWGS